MTREQWWEFAMHGTRTGKLATVRANGAPHVAPLWFVLNEQDGYDEIVFTTTATSLKGKALRRDPRIFMAVDDENPPFAYALFEAEATLSEDLDEMRPWTIKLATRYLGEEKGEAIGGHNAAAGEYLVRARIKKVIARANIAAG